MFTYVAGVLGHEEETISTSAGDLVIRTILSNVPRKSLLPKSTFQQPRYDRAIVSGTIATETSDCRRGQVSRPQS